MKIKPSEYNNYIQQYNLQKANTEKSQDILKSKKESGQTEVEASDSYTDKIEISKDFGIYQKAMQNIKKTDNVDNEARINRLAEQIKNGTYEIDPVAIAGKIIDKCL